MRKEGLEEIEELILKLKNQKMTIPEAECEIKKLYKKRDFDRGITLYNSLSSDYRLWGKINMSWPNANTFGPTYEVKHPKTKKAVKIPDRGWRWKIETFNDAAGFVDGEYQNITELHDGSFICGKIWFSKDEKTQPSSITYFDEVESFLLRSILSSKSDGGIELEKIFEGKSFFSYPKPSSLLQLLFNSFPVSSEDIFLDFFGGSGTTGQAVIELNKTDKANRKFILIQLPETTDEKSEAYKAGYKKISDITIERNKRVIHKIEKENAEQKKKREGELPLGMVAESNVVYKFKNNLGFKVFKLVKSNFPRVEFAADPEKTDEENIELLKKYISDKEAQLVTAFNRDELMTEILLKKGFNLNYTTEKQDQFKKNEIYLATENPLSFGEGRGEAKETLICLDVAIEMETVEYFKKHTDKKFICLERALDTTKKYNLKHYMGNMFNAF